ncbi:unnamed protein product [Dracunculus medinensis]|uniref:tRNA-uridine aminocarboxypropyltransferase 1 n=1 Tax=Dracunculus medinensis TaxID=318479 RepID=A0A0N4UNF9_DRAME|nr:unnamed protein product [Dracunculus medinensis]
MRQECSICKRKRMYFCYDCRRYMPGVQELVPTIELPVKIDIIKHAKEKSSKSTSIHCLLLSPLSTRLFNHNDKDFDYNNCTDTVLVYPSQKALTLQEYINKYGAISRFVFLDSTWHQVKMLRNLPQLKRLQVVRLSSYETLFWRPQKGYGMEYLATIEAIYYAIREQQKILNSNYNRSIDNLLFWFLFFRSKIPKNYFNFNYSKK